MDKWNKDLIVAELKSIANSLGKFPTRQDLQNTGRVDLRNAIILSQRPITEYADIMGLTTKTRKRNFWTPITIREELNKVCDLLGFPTRRELIDLGHGSLQLAMWKDGLVVINTYGGKSPPPRQKTLRQKPQVLFF